MMDHDKVDPAVYSFLKDKSALILDPSSSSRATLISAVKTLGIHPLNIRMGTDFDEGIELSRGAKFEVVVAEYDLGTRSGLDFIFNYRAAKPELQDSIFVLVSSTATDNIIVEAAEEEVSAFILKPFTGEKLTRYFTSAILSRLVPATYERKISEGKMLLERSAVSDAVRIFQEAASLHPKPSLAHYYLGKSFHATKELQRSVTEYDQGLNFNSIHYKCLTGKYEVLANLKDESQAYEIAKKIAGHFPVSPQRLETFIQLAVRTGHYKDVAEYYEIFSNLRHRSPHLIKCVTAALIVAGIHCLEASATRLATDFFRKAATASANSVKVLKRIIEELVSFGQLGEARGFFVRFLDDAKFTDEFAVAHYLIGSATMDTNIAIQSGKELLAKVQDPAIYRTLIGFYTKLQRLKEAQALANDAARLWPDLKDEFLGRSNNNS